METTEGGKSRETVSLRKENIFGKNSLISVSITNFLLDAKNQFFSFLSGFGN
jgi:hypothetical protein